MCEYGAFALLDKMLGKKKTKHTVRSKRNEERESEKVKIPAKKGN